MLNKLIDKYRAPILAILSVGILVGAYFLFRETQGNKEEIVIEKVSEQSNQQGASQGANEVTSALLKVDVEGAINNPGVYELEEGQIVKDAIDAAGGYSEDADTEWVGKNLNLAQKLTDAYKIYIPKKGETPEVSGVAQEASSDSGVSSVGTKVNINTASISELDTLPGIGEGYAKRIVEGRPYSRIEDIKNVKGIGDATYEKIKDQITV